MGACVRVCACVRACVCVTMKKAPDVCVCVSEKYEEIELTVRGKKCPFPSTGFEPVPLGYAPTVLPITSRGVCLYVCMCVCVHVCARVRMCVVCESARARVCVCVGLADVVQCVRVCVRACVYLHELYTGRGVCSTCGFVLLLVQTTEQVDCYR